MLRPYLSPIPEVRKSVGRLAGAMAFAAWLAGPGIAHSQQSPAQKVQVDTFATRTGLPRTWVVSVKPDIVVAVRDRDALGARNPADRVRLQGEVTGEEAAARLGYRSMRSAVEINCETRRDRVVEMEVFAGHNLKGAAERRSLPGGWVQPSEDAYMADVIRTVCRALPQRPQAASPTGLDAPPRLVERRPAPKPPTPLAATAGPAQVPDLRARRSVDPAPRLAPTAEGPIATAERPPRLLAWAEPSPPPAPQHAAPPPPARIPRPSAPEPRPGAQASASEGRPVVQIGALNSEAGARRAFIALGSLAGGGLSGVIQPSMVGERIYYRALVEGFSSRAEAAAFCAAVTRKGGTCFIR
jgi:cell division protein FtsN